jgi:integrase
MAEACAKAKIAPAISFHILRHTYASLLAMNAVPLPVIARALGHADTRMTERHYAHLQPSYVADTIRANLPKWSKDDATSSTDREQIGSCYPRDGLKLDGATGDPG